MKRFLHYLMVTGIVIAWVGTGAIAQDKPSTSDEAVRATAPSQATSASFTTFKNYPDNTFHLKVKEYIHGMQKGGHNLLIWRDSASNLSQYGSVRVKEFSGRLLPQQNVFPYDPYVALFNSVFRSTLKLPQKESPDALLIEGAIVECNPGSRAARAWVGMGAGRAGGAAVCEIYEPGKTNPCIRIYTRDTSAAGGSWGGDSSTMLNNILSQVAQRLAMTLNTTVTMVALK